MVCVTDCNGYYNLGVSEPRYDWGVWAYSGSEDSITIVQVQRLQAVTPLAILQARGVSEKAVIELIEMFISDNELMGWGAFKTPSLRNIALTEPDMHNGRYVSLRQVIEFYSFDNPDLIPADPISNPYLHPEMGRLPLNHDGRIDQGDGKANLFQIQDAESLLFFLLCLADQRVEYEKAPFDHPSITLVNDSAIPASIPKMLSRFRP